MSKYEIPPNLYPLVQSILDQTDCTKDEKDWVLKTYQGYIPWDEPVMPIVLIHLVSIKKKESLGVEITKHLESIEEKEQGLIDALQQRTEAIKTESQAVDESLQHANEEFSRKLARLNERFEKASKATIKTQEQLIQMHQQLKVRSRTTLKGLVQMYLTVLILGLVCGLYIQVSLPNLTDSLPHKEHTK